MQYKNGDTMKCPWRFAGKCFLIPSLIFVILLIGALVFDFVLGMDVPRAAIYLNFGIQFTVWLAISGGFLIASKRNEAKLQRLKREGGCYDGIVESLNPVYGVRLMHYLTVRADCSYMNRDGKKCLVRSNAFLLDGVGLLANVRGISFHSQRMGNDIVASADRGLAAQVYVNHSDPTDYAIEIIRESTSDIKADYDYR